MSKLTIWMEHGQWWALKGRKLYYWEKYKKKPQWTIWPNITVPPTTQLEPKRKKPTPPPNPTP